jgi:hypothetical protein
LPSSASTKLLGPGRVEIEVEVYSRTVDERGNSAPSRNWWQPLNGLDSSRVSYV